jgi:thiol-disulfide isomerase/thioredoxin
MLAQASRRPPRWGRPVYFDHIPELAPLHFVRSILLSVIAVVVGGAALAGGVYLRGHMDAPASNVITVKKPATERGNLGRRPQFWLADPEGVRHAVSEWDGKLLVMNFWATWCPPCRHEMPVFIDLQKRYASRGVQFLGVAIDDADKVRAFAAEIGLNYPTLQGQLDAIDVMSAYGNESGGLPFTVLIDRSGTIVARHPGVLDEASATQLIETLL